MPTTPPAEGLSSPSDDAPLLSLTRVSVTLSGRPALRDLTFSLRQGQSWAVTGGNGAGKTTFLRLARGDIPPDRDGIGRRVYAMAGRRQDSALGFRQHIGAVFPELQKWAVRNGPAVPALSFVLAGFDDALFLQGPPDPVRTQKARGAMNRLGAGHLAGVALAALSQGQMRLVLMARALAPDPLFLVLDEIHDGLDHAARVLVDAALSTLAASGRPMLAAAHHADDIPSAATHLLVLEDGRATHAGPLEQAGGHWPRPARTGALRDGTDVTAARHAPAGPTAPDMPPADPNSSTPDAPLCRIEQADVYIDRKKILTDINLTIRPGDRLAVTGPNGSGKSTLLELVMGLRRPALGGRIERPGLDPSGSGDIREIRRSVGYVSAALMADYGFDLPGEELVLSGFAASVGLYHAPSDAEIATARRWMDVMGVADLAPRRLSTLSTGQTARLFLARAMAPSPRLLLLDEPFSGLDATSLALSRQALSALPRRSLAVVMVTHRQKELPPEFDRRIVMRRGRIVAGEWNATPP